MVLSGLGDRVSCAVGAERVGAAEPFVAPIDASSAAGNASRPQGEQMAAPAVATVANDREWLRIRIGTTLEVGDFTSVRCATKNISINHYS
ncbi:hypothetical protein [Mycobacterium sp. MUNTM1]